MCTCSCPRNSGVRGLPSRSEPSREGRKETTLGAKESGIAWRLAPRSRSLLMIGQRPRLADCLPEISMFGQADKYFVSVQQVRVLIQAPRDPAHLCAMTGEN